MVLSTYIGWVDFSEADQKRAREYLRSLNEGTIDELGFGILRNMFADWFYPATSTTMTHARYFILVPAICISIERMGLSGERAARKCAELEHDLRLKLPIARRKEHVERYPSEDYWESLKTLGIFRFTEWSESFYFGHLDEYFSSRRTARDDDGAAHVQEEQSEHWDQELLELYAADSIARPNQQGIFPDDIDLDLRIDESRYLKRRYLNLADNEKLSLRVQHGEHVGLAETEADLAVSLNSGRPIFSTLS